MSERKAIYPGTFDPITLGHMSVVKRALIVFDKIIVAVAKDSHKNTFFTYDERYKILKEVFNENPRVEVMQFEGLLVEFAKKIGVNVILRGLRTVSDFEFEFQMALTNRKIDSSIETVFIMAEDHVSYFSSSLVREIAKLGGDISSLVPPQVIRWFKKKTEGK
ncbi:MAG: pantetheine-phosphate adenylyltransferase [Candidatus Calescibacterium sp.]|nr:pantetheine-phosphate adenylyltransferase [Candidatus Calescibacterium sp.]MCX7734103.1 pantetheine-phosphate adenylyltransferase [bacterium]MDW8087845.1 pantetheine-phosphate adenylyltransferase [Candidatus Calescibacterium sp.]